MSAPQHDPADEARRLAAQRSAVARDRIRRLRGRRLDLDACAAAASAALPRGRRTLVRVLAPLVARAARWARNRRPAAKAGGVETASREVAVALWRLRLARALAWRTYVPAWRIVVRAARARALARLPSIVVSIPGRRRRQPRLGVIVHGSGLEVAGVLRAARRLGARTTVVVGTPGRRRGSAVARAVAASETDLLLLLDCRAAAEAPWWQLAREFDESSTLVAITANGGWCFDTDHGAIRPIHARGGDGLVVAADDGALLLRGSTLRALPPPSDYVGTGWALSWSSAASARGLEVRARNVSPEVPRASVPPADLRRLAGELGPMLRRRVRRDQLAGGGQWCPRPARVALGPSLDYLAPGLRAHGLEVATSGTGDVHFTLAGGAPALTWGYRASQHAVRLPNGAGTAGDADSWVTAALASLARPSFRLRLWPRDWEAAKVSGDLPLADGLARALCDQGCEARVELLADSDGDGAELDVSVVLRGRRATTDQPTGQLNLLWLISHPDEVELREMNGYDEVLVASRTYADELRERLDVPVRTFMQCTDAEFFRPTPHAARHHQLLFVGNWRSEFRRVVWDVLPTTADLGLYGRGWDVLAPAHAKAEYVPHACLPALYSSCDILLNDHWDDMRRRGFVSNRILDALACEAFVISDSIDGVDDLDDGLVTYAGRADLAKKIAYYLDHPDARRETARRGRSAVLAAHTTVHRARELITLVDKQGAGDTPPSQAATACSREAHSH